MAISSNDAGVIQPDVTPKSLRFVPSTYRKRIIKIDKTLPTSQEVVGRRTGVSGIMPEIDHLTMLPATSVSVQRGRSEVGRKVNTMDERNSVASPTSNPAGAPPHLQRTAHPVNPILGRKKIKFQQGGILQKSIVPYQDPEFMFKDKYNTTLTPTEKVDFDKWVKDESTRQGRDILMDQGAYDVQGFWKSGDYKNRDADGHGSDKWKKPNHPTFSDQSQYHGADGFYGGTWGKDSLYNPSRQTRGLYDEAYYQRLFGMEPNRPEKLSLSKATNYTPSIYQEGGKLIPKKELSPAQVDSAIQAWRKSPEWYERASGRTEVTDSPIDMLLLGGAASYGGKAAGFLGNFLEKKAGQSMTNAVRGTVGKLDDFYDAASGTLGPVLKATRYGLPSSYGASKVINFLQNK